jgi:predicted alpha/beta-fold hydrolase
VPQSQNSLFHPPPFLVGGHRQTILGFWSRRYLGWPLPAEDMVVEAGDDARLLVRATWQPGPREARPVLVVLHGLGGSDRSPYSLSTGRLAFARGWHVLRANLRGAGDAEALCARLYNAGLDTDVLAVVESAARVSPRVSVVSFSLGASICLLALGRLQDRLPTALGAVAAVCPPLDLAACAAAMERPQNRFYQSYFLKNLRAAYRRRQLRRPDLYEAGRERGLWTIRAYDEAITAFYGGYRSADDYYERSSAGPWLRAIGRRVLILAAADDPLVPAESVARWPLPSSGLVEREMSFTGGHVGFVARTHAPGFFWAAERALDFLAS